jgi:hypothetical protein
MLDIAALVAGGAVASLHLRNHADGPLMRSLAWLFWFSFLGIGVTAAGPFSYLGRRYLRPVRNYPLRGDCQWIALGLPWVASAPICAALPSDSKVRLTIYPPSLSLMVAAACLYVLGVQWVSWRRDLSTHSASAESSWTQRVGMALAVAWPLQCGFALVTLSN